MGLAPAGQPPASWVATEVPKSHLQEHTLCLKEQLSAEKGKLLQNTTSSPAQVPYPGAQLSHRW